MRLKGTGTDPDHKYPDGLVFDAPPHAARKLVDEGFATVLDPKDDPARTESQIAAAIQRGDNLNDPTDAELAAGITDQEALASVHGGPVDEPVPGGATAKAPIGVGPETLPESSALANEAPASDAGSSTPAPSGSSPSSSEKELTPKQEAVARAKELDISHSGSEKEIRERISAKEKELKEAEEAAAAAAAAPSEETVARAGELGVDAEGTEAEVQERIADKEKELEAGQASS